MSPSRFADVQCEKGREGKIKGRLSEPPMCLSAHRKSERQQRVKERQQTRKWLISLGMESRFHGH